MCKSLSGCTLLLEGQYLLQYQNVTPLKRDLLMKFKILLYLLYLHIFTSRKRSLGQGNIFTGVCLSTGGGGRLPSMHHRLHDQRGLHPGILHPGILHPGGSTCKGGLHPGGSSSGESVFRGQSPPPLIYMGYKWAVRILYLFEIKIKRCKIYTEMKNFFAKFQCYIAELFIVQKFKC